jgi:hypothetical protein
MDSNLFFYRLYKMDASGRPIAFLGNAFPIEVNGGLVTCRHVLEISMAPGEYIAVFDNEFNTYTRLEDIRLPSEPDLDLAFLPYALQRDKKEFFPLLTPQQLTMGEDIYSFGYFAIGGSGVGNVERGYFGGRIVNIVSDRADRATITLPFPVLEGLSGSPILTYHNGPKVVGMAIGSRSSRILAAEIVDVEEGDVRLREITNRIVEFGVGYHAVVLIEGLLRLGANQLVVTTEQVP